MDPLMIKDVADSLPQAFAAECPSVVRRCQQEAYEAVHNSPKFSEKAAQRHFPYERINTVDSALCKLAEQCGMETRWVPTHTNENCWHYLEMRAGGWLITVSHVPKGEEAPDAATHRKLNAKLNSIMEEGFLFEEFRDDRPNFLNGIITYRTSFRSDVDLDWVRFTIPSPESKSAFHYCDFEEIRCAQQPQMAAPVDELPIKLRKDQVASAE